MQYDIEDSVIDAAVTVGVESGLLLEYLDWRSRNSATPTVFWPSPKFDGQAGILKGWASYMVTQDGARIDFPEPIASMQCQLQIAITLAPLPTTRKDERGVSIERGALRIEH